MNIYCWNTRYKVSPWQQCQTQALDAAAWEGSWWCKKCLRNLVQSLCNSMLMQHDINNMPIMRLELESSCLVSLSLEALVCTGTDRLLPTLLIP